MIYQLNDVLDTNEKGVELIKLFESFSPTWYLCPASVWTLSWGITEGLFPNVTRKAFPGPITEKQGEKLLFAALAGIYEPAVETAVKVPLTSNQYSALVSFVYNVGSGAFRKSTLLKKVNAGDLDGAAAEFGRWVRGGGRILQGLVNRRKAEAALFREDERETATWLSVAESLPVLRVEPVPLETLPTIKPEKVTFLEPLK